LNAKQQISGSGSGLDPISMTIVDPMWSKYEKNLEFLVNFVSLLSIKV
jgi:hypothetical protein